VIHGVRLLLRRMMMIAGRWYIVAVYYITPLLHSDTNSTHTLTHAYRSFDTSSSRGGQFCDGLFCFPIDTKLKGERGARSS